MGIITFDDVRFAYEDTGCALDGLTFDIASGEFACVLGGNGSGKSTMARHINALFTPDSGTVRVLGRDTSNGADIAFIRSKVGMVFQNPDDQIVTSIVENDVAFGPENLGIPPEEIRNRVTGALHQVGLEGYEKRDVATLSGGEKQRVAIAGALAMQPSVLVLDEADAMLDPRGRNDLMRICHELNDTGMTIVLITHSMEEAALADRVIVLEAGRIALDGSPDNTLTNIGLLESLKLDTPFAVKMSRALQERGLPISLTSRPEDLEARLREMPPTSPGKTGETIFPRLASTRSPDASPASSDDVAIAIAFNRVSFSYRPPERSKRKRRSRHVDTGTVKPNCEHEDWALRNVSFSVQKGSFLGIAGHTGSGKSTLVQLMNGLLQPTEGTVLACGRDLADKHAAIEARRDIGVVFQYPERQLFAATVFDDVAFGPRNLGVPANELDTRVRWALELVHLPVGELRDRSPFALSGGQQRRVALAGVLAMRPSTLVLDEPAAGLDPHARKSLLELVREFHDEAGLTVVMVSHDMDDLAQLCDRIMVLNQGRIAADGMPTDIFADEDALTGIGLGIPSAMHLANQLGLAYDGIPTIDSLADRIAGRWRAEAAR